MADVLQEYLVSLGFDVKDESGWTQALNRAGQRVKAFHDLQTQYGKLGVQVVKEAIKERETVEKALEVNIRRAHQDRQKLAEAVEKALGRAVREGHQERTRLERQTTVEHDRAERAREQATQRTHSAITRSFAALTAASTAFFVAMRRTVVDLSTVEDVSRRTGASAQNIRALEDAYKKVGRSAADARGDIESFAAKGRTDFAAMALRQSFGVDRNADPTQQMQQIADRLKAQFGNQGQAGYAIAAQFAESMGLSESQLHDFWTQGPAMRAEMDRSLQVRKDQNDRAAEDKRLMEASSNLWRRMNEDLEKLGSDTGVLSRLTTVLDDLANSKVPYVGVAFLAAGGAMTLLAGAAALATARLAARTLLGGSLLGGAGRAASSLVPGAVAGAAGAGLMGTLLRGLGLAGLAGGAAWAGGELLERILPSQRHDLRVKDPKALEDLERSRPEFLENLRKRRESRAGSSFSNLLYGRGSDNLGLGEATDANRTLHRIEASSKETAEAVKDLGKKAERQGLLEALFGKGAAGGGGIGMGGAGGVAGVAGGGDISTGGAGGGSGSSVISGRAAGGRAQGALRDRIAVAKAAAMEQLRKEGVPENRLEEAANLLTGQAIHESKLNPTAHHDANTGYGIYGARNPPGGRGRQRASEMIDWIKKQGGDPNDLSWQMREMAHRAASGDYPQTREALFNADAARRREQTFALTKEFENPAFKGDRSGSVGMAASIGANADALKRTVAGGPSGGVLGKISGMGADRRLIDIMNAAAANLPQGYTLEQTSGLRHRGRGFHPKGLAADFQILDPQGRPIRNRGEDVTGLYTRLARAAKTEQQRLYPELTGRLAWGGAFGTSRSNPNEKDLMHFDLGGERGRFAGNRLSNMLGISSAEATERVANIRRPAAIAPAPNNTVSNKTNDVKMDNDVNITIHGAADAGMIAAGVSRVQRGWAKTLQSDLEHSSR